VRPVLMRLMVLVAFWQG